MSPKVFSKVDEFFSNYPSRSLPKGQLIIFGNQEPDSVFYIKTGKVREYDISYRGDELIVNVFKAPAFFPMSWAINKTHNQFFYKTEAATVVHIVPPEDAVEFLKKNPDVLFDLLSRLYRGVDAILGRLVHLMSGTAKSRLVYEIIIECRRFGKKQHDNTYLLCAHESDLAARSGLSRETVSREIKSLKTRGIISVVSRGIVVKNLTALETIVGSEI